MQHPNHVVGFEGTLETLAKNVGNMDYASATAFLDHLAKDIRRQADGDAGRGRPKLAARLYETAAYLESARDALGVAWTICEPYMHNQKAPLPKTESNKPIKREEH